MLGWSVPRVHRRGAGLGNECIGWGKAFLGAQALGLRTVSPAWGLNRRGYRIDFHSNRFDWISHRMYVPGRRIVVDRVLLQELGEHNDYYEAMLELGRRVKTPGGLVLEHRSGMSGGYLGIQKARNFLFGQLLGTRLSGIHTSRSEAGEPVIAVHIRGDDFHESESGPKPGEFNKAIPLRWYIHVINLFRRFDERVKILVLTDIKDRRAVAELQETGATILSSEDRNALDDLSVMVEADALVCSVSSFSMLAAFLSGKPYVWFGPHLFESGGWLHIWNHGPGVAEIDSRSLFLPRFSNEFASDKIVGRGIPIWLDDVSIPDGLAEYLEITVPFQKRASDLMYYGMVPGRSRG